MTKLSPKQIAQVAAGAGFAGAGLRRAVAVALAESGGDTRAVGVNRDSHRSRDRGLWQINSYWHKEVTDGQAFDPAQAAAAAYRISKGGTDWHEWSTWPAAAGAQMGRARIAVAQAQRSPTPAKWIPGPGFPLWIPDNAPIPNPLTPDPNDALPLLPSPDGGDILGAAGDVAASAAKAVVMLVHAGAWLSDAHNWARVGMVVGGGAALLLGVGMLAKSGAAGSTAARAAAIPGKAANVVPIARVAKVAKAATATKAAAAAAK